MLDVAASVDRRNPPRAPASMIGAMSPAPALGREQGPD